MSSVTISISIKLKRRPNGEKAGAIAETYARAVSQVTHRQVERLLSRLTRKAKDRQSKIWTHDMLCECTHKCYSSPRNYWKFLKSELVWKNGHLQ